MILAKATPTMRTRLLCMRFFCLISLIKRYIGSRAIVRNVHEYIFFIPIIVRGKKRRRQHKIWMPIKALLNQFFVSSISAINPKRKNVAARWRRIATARLNSRSGTRSVSRVMKSMRNNVVQRQASPKNSIAFGFIVILAPVAITMKPSTNSAPTMIRIKLSLKKCSKAVKKHLA